MYHVRRPVNASMLEAGPGTDPVWAPVKKMKENGFFWPRAIFLLFRAYKRSLGITHVFAQQRSASGIDPAQKQRSQAPL